MTKISELLGRPADGSGPLGAAESALSSVVAEMADELVETKNLVAVAKKEEVRLARQAEVAARAAEEWGQRAMSAVRARDDVVARDALVRRLDGERKAGEFRAALDLQRREVERLKGDLFEQSLRVEEAKQQKNALLLRARRAGAEAVLDAAANRGDGSPLDLFARLEAALAAVEREGVVARELSDEAIASTGDNARDEHRIETDLLLLKRLVKAPALTAAKPLAKTSGAASESEATGTSRERRTKR